MGRREYSTRYVEEALRLYAGEPEIVAAAVAALCNMYCGKVEEIAALDSIDPKIRVLAALQNTDPKRLDLSGFRIEIEKDEDEVLKLALITVGLNRDVENLFHPRCENGKVVKELGQHDNRIVVQYSVWAVLENDKLTIDDLGVPLDSLEKHPANVQSKVLQVIAELEADHKKRHRFVEEGPYLPSAEAREGLAKGLRSIYYDGVADVTLDWFDQETHLPIREWLAEHFSRFSSDCPPYEEKSLSILESSPELKDRLFLGAEGKPIFRKLKAEDIRSGTADLFEHQLSDEFVSRLGIQASTIQGSKKMKKKVLMLSASPLDQGRLRIDQECRDLKEKLNLVKNPVHELDMDVNLAVRTDQIQDAILNERPDILHFSGHGGGGKLCFENASGETAEVSGKALAELIELSKDSLKCVVLNACYSKEIGDLIKPHVECVIGCDGTIDDDAAVAFARAFYRALANGISFTNAFRLARNEVSLGGMEQEAEKYVCL